MSAHTPGPWRHYGRVKPVGSPDDGGVHNLYCGHVSTDSDTYRGEVCNIQSADHITGISREEAAANARLIAAAPDMLDALVGAEQWLSGWGSAAPYIDLIRAAIAKATGEHL